MSGRCVLTFDGIKKLLIEYGRKGGVHPSMLEGRRYAVAFIKDYNGDYSTIVVSVEGTPSKGQVLIALQSPFNIKSIEEEPYYPLALHGIVIRDMDGHIHRPKKVQGCFVDVKSFLEERKDIILVNRPVPDKNSYLKRNPRIFSKRK